MTSRSLAEILRPDNPVVGDTYTLSMMNLDWLSVDPSIVRHVEACRGSHWSLIGAV